jgi:hypothetical protein
MPLCEGYRKPANCRAPFSVSRDQLPTSAVSGRCLRNSFNNSSQDSATFSTMSQNSSTMSRDEIVESVSRFYTFLTTHPYLPSSAIKTPPPAGWPEEYREIFCKWAKPKRSWICCLTCRTLTMTTGNGSTIPSQSIISVRYIQDASITIMKASVTSLNLWNKMFPPMRFR